jgi:cytochrome P450
MNSIVNADFVKKAAENFDHHSQEFRACSYEVYDYLRNTSPIHYTNAWGGYWVLTRYEDVMTVARDDVNFSAKGGVSHPPVGLEVWPIQLDPPLSTKMKFLITPYFSPRALEDLMGQIRPLTTQLVDAVIEKGSCDFPIDLGIPAIGIITMRMAGIDESKVSHFAHVVHSMIYQEGTPEELWAFQQQLDRDVHAEVEAQVHGERKGIIGVLLGAELEGKPVDVETVCAIINLLMLGGLDTTQAMMGSAIVHLYRNPELRKMFVEQPELRQSIVEEYLRFYAPQQALFRTVVNDITISGHTFRKGERVMMSWAAANRDPAAFDRASEFVPNREPNRHMAFGVGSHRCLGSSLARQEIQAMLEEVLIRMPDYKVDESALEMAPDISSVYGYKHIPMTFTPGQRSDAK